jgi:nucleotide-binding universal stress UspA family protein
VDEGHPRTAIDIDPDGLEEIAEEYDTTHLEAEKKKLEQYFVDRVTKKAGEQGLKVTTDVRIGNPANEIVEYASGNGIDMIVLGAHGRTALGSALMGSITTEVIHKCKIPVLVIPVHED